ncbi:hypothetical protein RF11_13486 [Thelohanellus kitauei]|uniref:ISXO2-like transposase domain-containing protein n=1 Tax=Thelohanellus kitauei TaxID=669202 RepID=A0A0C2N5R1_THEKT|nr:hypothetical protein RF11_13486 [Thelohanellus kitauei]
MCREICVRKLFEFWMNPGFFLGGERITIAIDDARKRRMSLWGHSKENSRSNLPSFIDFGSESNSRQVLDHTKMDQTWYTQCSKCRYHSLDQMVHLHSIVNHSQTFVDPTTGAHTNTIEGNWKNARSHMPSMGTRKWLHRSYLLKYFHRQQFHGCTFNQSFGRFLAHIKDIYNPYMENKFIERIQLTNEELRFIP